MTVGEVTGIAPTRESRSPASLRRSTSGGPTADPPAEGDSRTGSAVTDDASLRAVFGCFPTGVTAVCSVVDDRPVGMAVSSFTSVSLAPPLVSACLATTSTTWRALRTVKRLGVSILAAHHGTVCRQLAGNDPSDRFAGVSWTPAASGAIRIRAASAWFECELEREISVGDHILAILRIVSHLADPAVEPLVFHRSGFRKLLAS